MKRLAIMALLLGSFLGFGQNFTQTFEEANKLYEQKEYRQALEKYTQISQEGYESAALYYNMGNAYFKTNQLGESILYYERARQLAPYDDDIRQNLEIARDATVDRFERVPKPLVRTAYLSTLKALSPGSWATIATIAFLILLAGTYMYLFTSRLRVGFALGVAGLIIGALSLSLAFAHQNHLHNNRPAVVMATSSYIKSGPSAKAEDVFILHEGTSAVVTEDYEGWKKIKLPDGKVGWIESKDLVEV